MPPWPPCLIFGFREHQPSSFDPVVRLFLALLNLVLERLHLLTEITIGLKVKVVGLVSIDKTMEFVILNLIYQIKASLLLLVSFLIII